MNLYAKMHAAVEWRLGTNGGEWQGCHDLTAMVDGAVRLLQERGAFERATRGPVSGMVNQIVSSGAWDGVYHVVYKERLAELLDGQKQSEELYWVRSVFEVLRSEEHARGGAVRLVVVYVEPGC